MQLGKEERFWRHMDGMNNVGRFIPDGKLRTPAEQQRADKERSQTRGESTVETEVGPPGVAFNACGKVICSGTL